MSVLKQDPPESIKAKLREQGVEPEALDLATTTDINLRGGYETQWLLVGGGRVFVATDSESPEIIFTMRMEDADEYRVRSAVGSGLLQARVESMQVDVIRFTNRLSEVFVKVSRKMDRALKGVPITVDPEDDRDERRCPTCGLLLEFQGDSCPRCVSRGAVLVRMFRLMAPYKISALLMMSLLVLGIGFELVGPQLTRYLVDNVLPGDPEAVRQIMEDPAVRSSRLTSLRNVVLILFSMQAMMLMTNIAKGRLSSRIGTAITFDMRGRLVEHLQKLSLAYFDRQQVGSLVGRVAFDTEALHGFVSQLTNGFFFQIIMVLGVGTMMFTIDVELALYTLIPAPFVMVGSVFFWRYVFPRHYRFWDSKSKQAGMLSGNLSGIRVVKAFGQEKRELKRFNKASAYMQTSQRGVEYANSVFHPSMTFLFQIGGCIVWFVGGWRVMEGALTLGKLMAYFGYLWMFYAPLTMLSQFANWLTQFVTQAHRIFEILDTPSEVRDPKKPVETGTLEGRIEFQGVTFGYTRSDPVLQDVNIDIKPGEMIGVVGKSGSGKTTIVNLLCRFYDVNEGAVRVDGVDVRDYRHVELLQRIGVVLQEPFLFRGSIMENLVYGKPEATPEQIITAAKAGNAHNFILRRAHAYDTWVGERGAGLSGGERQRIGIARVLLTDPRILILDEATSSVDAESEAAIQAALAELVKGRTTIAIAHRLSTLRNSDRILVVDRGKIVESGSHDELVTADGVYARLVRLQGMSRSSSVDQLEQEAARADVRLTDDGPLPDPHGHQPRWLAPENAHVHLGNLGALHVTVPRENIYGGVYAVRCMPVAFSRRYISLRYFDHENREVEVGLIRDLDEWPAEAQELIEEALARRYFVHTIESIVSIRPLSGYLEFHVETDLGPMRFMMRWQQHRAHSFGENGKMIIDTDENRYLIPDVEALSDGERRIFMRHIYW